MCDSPRREWLPIGASTNHRRSILLWGHFLLYHRYMGMGFETKEDLGSILVFPLYFTWICIYAIRYSVDFSPNKNHRVRKIINHRFSDQRQISLWIASFASFAVKVPMVPVHIWFTWSSRRGTYSRIHYLGRNSFKNGNLRVFKIFKVSVGDNKNEIWSIACFFSPSRQWEIRKVNKSNFGKEKFKSNMTDLRLVWFWTGS